MTRTSSERRRRSAQWAGGIAMALLVAGCGQGGQVSPRGTPQVVGDGPLWFTVLGKPGEAILMRVSSDGGASLGFVVAGSPGERQVGQIPNPLAGIEGGWIRTAVANEAGLAALVVEVPDDRRRLVVYDLNKSGAPIQEAPSEPWHALGPRGIIAIGKTTEHGEDPREIVVHDLGSTPSTAQTYRLPDGVQAMGLAAGGSKLAAARRLGERGAEVGTLGGDGAFVPGLVDPLFVTGRERSVGPKGETLGFAHGDGQGWSSSTIFGQGAGGEVTWYESRSDRNEPEPTGVAWDPAGRGLWLALLTPSELRVALLREPMKPDVVAALPRPPSDEETGPPVILGIHPGGETIALGRPGLGGAAEFGPTAHTWLIDVASGAVTERDGAFVGWAAWTPSP